MTPRSVASDPLAPTAEIEAQWFADEVQPHEPQLRGYLRRTFPGVRDVDDIVQEAYLRLWRKQAASPLGSARAFLFRIARNFAVDILRRTVAPSTTIGEDLFDENASPVEHLSARENESILVEALDGLPRRQREVVTLCKLQGKTARDVASGLGISEKTVNEHLYRGLQRLGEELQRRGFDSARS